jgi:hypothetical protein
VIRLIFKVIAVMIAAVFGIVLAVIAVVGGLFN